MMTSELHTLSGAYAIDALSEEEAERFETHMAVCDACQAEVRELRAAAAAMGASEAATPPAYLKTQVMAAVDREPQMPPLAPRTKAGPISVAARWTPWLLAAAAVVLVVAAGVGISQLQNDDQAQLAAPVAAVFDAPDAHTVTVSTSKGADVELATSASLGEMALDTDELPGLSDQQVYQLWTVRDGEMSSAGLLTDPDQGAAMPLPGKGTAVAITIEPAGGSPQPTSHPIAVVEPSEM